jgi:hypothetical protein
MRLELRQRKIKLANTQKSAETYRKLYESAGHGGISKQGLMEKQAEYNKAENEFHSTKVV